MRPLVRLFLLMLVLSVSVNGYSNNISVRGLEFLKRSGKGAFTGAYVKVEDGTEVTQFSPISVKHENILKNLESKYGKVVDVLWLGELETEATKDGRVKILQINENSGTIAEKPELCKNASVVNIYNCLLSHEETRELVSKKPKLIKYDEKGKYVHLGIDPNNMTRIRHEFWGLRDLIRMLIKYANEKQAPPEGSIGAIREKSFPIINMAVASSPLLKIVTGLPDNEVAVLFGLLYKFTVEMKDFTDDELKVLDIIFDDYKRLQDFPEYYECAFNEKKDFSVIEARRSIIREKIREYTGVYSDYDTELVYALMHKIINEKEERPMSLAFGPIADFLDQDGVLDFILEVPKADSDIITDAEEFVGWYRQGQEMKKRLRDDYLDRQEEELLEQKRVTETSVYTMKKIIKMNMQRTGMTMEELVKNAPNLFPDNNLIYMLNEARTAILADDEKVILDQVREIIKAKKANHLDVGEGLEHKFREVESYLDGEKDRDIFKSRLGEHSFANVNDAVTSLIEQDGVLWQETAKLLLGTKERNFKDSIYTHVQKYSSDVDLKNRVFLLTLLVMETNSKLNIDNGAFDITSYIIKLMRTNKALFNEFKSFNIAEEAMRSKVNLDLAKALEKMKEIRVRVELEERTFK